MLAALGAGSMANLWSMAGETRRERLAATLPAEQSPWNAPAQAARTIERLVPAGEPVLLVVHRADPQGLWIGAFIMQVNFLLYPRRLPAVQGATANLSAWRGYAMVVGVEGAVPVPSAPGLRVLAVRPNFVLVHRE